MKQLYAAFLLTLPIAAAAQQFVPAVQYSCGTFSAPYELALGDMNRDGWVDIVTANWNTQSVGVLLNNKDGTFAPVITYDTGQNAGKSSLPRGVALGDVNGDGYLDIAVANDQVTFLTLLLNKKNGTFAAPAYLPLGNPSGPLGVVFDDFNRDGQLDVAAACYKSLYAGILLGKGGGNFAPVVNANPQGSLRWVATGDVNGDGYPDLATANYDNHTASILLNKQDGTFALGVPYSTGETSFPTKVALADLNGDGAVDMVTTNSVTSKAGVFLNKRNGTFANMVAYPVGDPGYPVGLAVGDVNGDGRPDIVTANGNQNSSNSLLSRVGVLLNQGNGLFAAPVTFKLGVNVVPFGVQLADVDKDGKLDIITANFAANTVSVLLNQTTVLATVPVAGRLPLSVFPNPAHGAATLSYYLSVATIISADVLDELGRPVATVAREQHQAAGSQVMALPALPAGIYTMRLLHDGVAEYYKLAVE